MKTRLLTTVLFMAASLSGFAQDRATKAKLEEATGRVLDFIMKDDFQSLLEITYPTLFSEITEKEYLENLKKESSGEGFTVIPKNTDTQISYGAIKPFDGGHYCVIYYNYRISISLDKPLKKQDEEGMLKRFKKDHAAIAYEPSDNSLIAKGRRALLAVSDNATANFWNFIIDTKAPYAQNIIPQDAKVELNPEAYPLKEEKQSADEAVQAGKVTNDQINSEKRAAEKKAAANGGKN